MTAMPDFFATGARAAAATPERRESARSRLFTLVEAKGSREPLWALDLGLGGMQCRSKRPRWPGTYLDLSFVLPGTDEKVEAGSQVLTLDQLEDGELSLGLRFCMLSPRDQRAIYRFLDARRQLWSKEPVATQAAPQPPSLLEQWLAVRERPFEGLLLEAQATIKARRLRHLAFVRGIPTGDLPLLSELSRGAF